MVAAKEKKGLINYNLISLKAVVFFTFVGFACVHILNSTLPFYLGLTFDEYRLITIITPLISLIGPLIVGPLADHLAAKNPNNFGRCLRLLTAICLILSAIFYAILFFIPPTERSEIKRPHVSFGCNSNGGFIFQERCYETGSCHSWDTKHGDLILYNCSYACQHPIEFTPLYKPWTNLSKAQKIKAEAQQQPLTTQDSDYSDEDPHVGTTQATYSPYPIKRRKRSIDPSLKNENNKNSGIVERKKREYFLQVSPPQVIPPHLCEATVDENNITQITKCHVLTEHSKNLKMKVTLKGPTNQFYEADKDTNENWCYYPVDGIKCDIPEPQIDYMVLEAIRNNSACNPMIRCHVLSPYDTKSSVLVDSSCIAVNGDPDVTVTTYFILRPIASIFLLAAWALLNTAIVIATRETSTGRGEICRQYAWAAIAWIIFIPFLVLYREDIYKIHIHNYYFNRILNTDLSTQIQEYLIILLVTAVLAFGFAALILLFSTGMPLSPPEWWWHTKTGMLVYPMSAIRKYFPEMFGLCLVTILLGLFWGSIHSYLPWVYKDVYGISYCGILLVIVLFFNVDKFIEYCSHSNILIAIFALYIIRFTGIHINDVDITLTIIMEILEPLYVTIAFITCIMYMRHIIPRKYTATGQAVIVAAHFCIGKFLGAIIGLAIDEKEPEKNGCIYDGLAYAALIISLIYFTLYNLILAPRCTAKPQPAPQLTLTNLSQQQPQHQQQHPNSGSLQNNGANGNYTPLRVYHNERGKKGQFRY